MVNVNLYKIYHSAVTYYENKKNMFFLTVVSIFLWGVAAHGMCIFNKYSWHDDMAAMFGTGMSIENGRWMMYILEKFDRYFFGVGCYSTPVFSAVEAFLFIVASAMIIFNLFRIERKIIQIAICGIMVTMPTITALCGFMYLFPKYQFGLFLVTLGSYAVISASDIFDYGKVYRFLIYGTGLILIVLGLGIYTAYFAVMVCLLAFFLLTMAMNGVSRGIDYVRYILKAIITAGASLFLWYAVTRIFQIMLHVDMTPYAGLNKIGSISPIEYIKKIRTAYHAFFSNADDSYIYSYNMYPMQSVAFKWLMIVLIIAASVLIVWSLLKNRKNLDAAVFVFCIVLSPLCINCIFVLADGVHSMMTYSQVFLPVLLVIVFQYCYNSKLVKKQNLINIAAIIAILLSISYARYANVCYLKAELLKEEAISYFNTLITRIKSAEGYADELPVAMVDRKAAADLSAVAIPEFNKVITIPYWHNMMNLVADYAWYEFMSRWCGYAPALADASIFSENEVVKDMPCYPDDGSIQVIDNTVVVKFGEDLNGE